MKKTFDVLVQFSYLCEFPSVILTAFPSFNLHSTPCKSEHACVVAMCMCVSSGLQCFLLGLIQASASEDCRLMWPISSDYSCTVAASLKHTCIQMHSGTKTNHSNGKSLRMWFMHLFVLHFIQSAAACQHISYVYLFNFLLQLSLLPRI